MPYSVIPTVNPGNVIASATWGNIVKADVEYIYNGRPTFATKRDNGASYSTTGTTFAAVDSTNLAATLTINSGKVQICATGVVHNPDAGNSTSGHFDFFIDGTRVGSAGADGLYYIALGGSGFASFCLAVEVTGLSIGSHIFQLVWKKGASGAVAITLASGQSGGAVPLDTIPTFSVSEVG